MYIMLKFVSVHQVTVHIWASDICIGLPEWFFSILWQSGWSAGAIGNCISAWGQHGTKWDDLGISELCFSHDLIVTEWIMYIFSQKDYLVFLQNALGQYHDLSMPYHKKLISDSNLSPLYEFWKDSYQGLPSICHASPEILPLVSCITFVYDSLSVKPLHFITALIQMNKRIIIPICSLNK